MEFRILGPLEVIEEGRPLPIGGQKQRALLAVLLLHANRVVSTDLLIEALWEEEPPETAQKALQVYVSQLRKLIGRERLQTKPPGYLLRVAEEELDVGRYQRLREEGEHEQALSLWRGPPLAEFAYSRFAQTEIARLEELRLACLEERIEQDLAQGRHRELVGELEALVAEHPLRERLRGQLMLALYRSGRQAEALDVYQEGRRLLSDELGLEPGKELRELEKAILLQAPALEAANHAGVEEPPRGASRGVFVGREPELQHILSMLEDVLAGHGRVVLVAGEPGIGKSRLCDELIGHARQRRARVLVGRCWEAGGAPAYWPWVQALRAYLREADDAVRAQIGAGASDIAQMLPEVRNLLPDLPPPPPAESEGARFRLFDATASFLKSAAAAQPIALVLDDLHAADTPSLLLLEFLAGELAQSRILILGAFRDVDPTLQEPLSATLASLARQAVTRRVALRGLAERDVADFIELTEGVAPRQELVEAIHAETEGNPLFVGEVVRLLAQEGLLEGGREDVDRLGVPQGVREVIGRRLGHLTDRCRQTLTLAAVLGREFGLVALEQVSGLRLEELLDVLDEAMGARVVGEVPGSPGRLRFAHALIRDTIYEELTPVRRIGLHRLAGEALETLYAHDPEPHLAELAFHFFEAAPGGDVGRAIAHARRAADRAVGLLAYEEAARLYELGLQALELSQPVDAGTRCELLLGLGEAQARAGNESAATSAFLLAAEIARSAGSAEHLARAGLGYGGRFVWAVGGLHENVVPLLEDALRGLGKDSALRAKALARLAGALRDRPDPERRDQLSLEAVDIARRVGDRSALAYALDGRYSAMWGPDNAEERLPIADEIFALAEEVGDRERAIQGRFYRAAALLEMGEVSDVHAELDAMSQLADELRQPAQRWYVATLEAILALLEGDFEVARERIPQALELSKTMSGHLPRGSFVVQMLMLHRQQGSLTELIEAAEQVVEVMPTMSVFRCMLANLYSELGRREEARVTLESLAEGGFDLRVANDRLFGWCLLAEVCSSLGDVVHAPRLYALLRRYGRRNAVCHPACATGSVSRYLGLLSATLSHWEEAERHFEQALEMNERMGARPWLAHTQEDYARMLLGRGGPGDAERARELLEAAWSTYRELGMQGPLTKATARMER